MKTLVIILCETRAHELTFDNFKKNVIDELNADLCLCIGVKSDYDYNNPFYLLAKYKFVYDEPDDFASAFEYANNTLSLDKSKFDELQEPLHWREFLKIKDQYLGGIKDHHNQHPGSAGILIFFRWYLLHNLVKSDIVSEYDRFVITRSDFIYQLPHPKMDILDPNLIWIPNSEYNGGYTDRHVVLSKSNYENYLNILNNMVYKSNEYINGMKNKNIYNWNLERVIKFHLEQNNVLHLVREFPYIMYAVRNINGTTRWSVGTFNNVLGYYIKYNSEYDKSNFYKSEFEKSGLSINEFYDREVTVLKK
jgi:hypothetical protein